MASTTGLGRPSPHDELGRVGARSRGIGRGHGRTAVAFASAGGRVSARRVPFNALAPGVRAIRGELDAAVARVLDSGWFLLGPQLERFERTFAAYHGDGYEAVGVGSGTDALRIGLEA